MSSRAPIQVPEELKNDIEGMKTGFYAKTNYEVIEKLIRYYRTNEAAKAKQREEIESNMIDIGPEAKKKFSEFMDQMGFRYPVNAFLLLLGHFNNSDNMNMETFNLYRKLKGE